MKLQGVHSDVDSIVATLTDASRRLVSVDLTKCTGLTDLGISRLALQPLRSLCISGCFRVTSTSLSQLPTTLRHLDVSWCHQLTPTAVSAFAATCPRLTHLNLRGLAPSLDDDSLMALTNSCPHLEYLDVSSSNPFGGNLRVTEAGFLSLSSLTSLRTLSIGGMTSIGDSVLATTLFRLPLIERIDLTGCIRLTGQFLSDLLTFEAAPSLQHIECAHSALSKDALESFWATRSRSK